MNPGGIRPGAVAALIGSCVVWSGNYVIGKLLMEQAGVTPSGVSFWRFAIAGIFMLTIAVLVRGPGAVFRFSAKRWGELAGQGVLGMCVVGILMFRSEQLASAITASMLDALIPVAILIGGAVLGEKLSRWQVVGMGVSLLGCLLVIRVIDGRGVNLQRFGVADLLILGAAAAWAAYVLWGRWTLKIMDSLIYTAWAMIAGATGTLLYAVFDHRMLMLPALTPEVTGLMALLIAGPTLAAFWLWNIATRSVPLPLLNITQYLIPISAILFAHFILRENLSVWQCAGGVLIVVGVCLDPSVAGFLRRKASKNNSI